MMKIELSLPKTNYCTYLHIILGSKYIHKTLFVRFRRSDYKIYIFHINIFDISVISITSRFKRKWHNWHRLKQRVDGNILGNFILPLIVEFGRKWAFL